MILRSHTNSRKKNPGQPTSGSFSYIAYIISRLFPATMSEMLFQLPYRACFQEIQILSISPAH